MALRRFLPLFILFYARVHECANKTVNWKVKYEKSVNTIGEFGFVISFEAAHEQTQRFELAFAMDAHCAKCELEVRNEIDEEFAKPKQVLFTIKLTTKDQNEDEAADLPLIRFIEFVVQYPNFENFYTINLQNVDHFGHICKRIHFDGMQMPNSTNFIVLFSKGIVPRGNEQTTENDLILIGHAPIMPGQQTVDVKMAVDLNKQVKKYASIHNMRMDFFEFEHLSESEVGNADECAICLAEFGGEEKCWRIHRSDRQQTTPHVFHQHCIFKWFEKCRNCPSCRNEIKAKKEISLLPLLSAADDQCQDLCENAFACLSEMAQNDEQRQNTFRKRQATIALDKMTQFVDNLNREAIILFDLEKDEVSFGVRLIGMENGQIVLFNQQIPVKESLEQILHDLSLHSLPETMRESAKKLLDQINSADLYLQTWTMQTVHSIQLLTESETEDNDGG